jgi:VWFA-related protein
MRVRATAVTVLGLCLASTGVGLTQSTGQNAQAPTFRGGTQAVQVDVRVFDRDGRFVSDLTLDDFEVFEKGVPQPASALFLVGRSPGARADEPAIVTSRTPVSGGSAPVPKTAARQTWIFAFDLNHLAPGGGIDRAKAAVREYLSTRFAPGDVGGILAGARMINNRLTSVRDELVTAVDQVKAVPDARSRMVDLTREWPRLRDEAEALAIAREDRDAITRATARACTDDPTACQSADLAVRDKARRLRSDIQRATLDTLNALTALSNGLARVPGPKTIVLFSEGFVVQELESSLRTVVGQAARSGARVYAIDVRGLNRGPAAAIGDQAAVDDAAGGPARFDMGEDGPNSMAVDTGGLMIRNDNNLSRALQRVAEDAEQYYVLGYAPTGLVLDGTYREIEVRVKRPGVTVRARRGYLALAPSQLLVPQPIKR